MAMLLVDYKQKEIYELGLACAAAEVAKSCFFANNKIKSTFGGSTAGRAEAVLY